MKPVYALVGADAFLQLQKLAGIARLMPKDTQRLDLDGERAALAEVLDEVRSFALFGSGKLVVIRNAEAFITRFREQLEDYLAAPCDSATLVLRAEKLPANQRDLQADRQGRPDRGLQRPHRRPQPGEVGHEQAKAAHRVAIAPDAAALLADLVGNDLGRLDSELAKLAIQSDGKPIDVKHRLRRRLVPARAGDVGDDQRAGRRPPRRRAEALAATVAGRHLRRVPCRHLAGRCGWKTSASSWPPSAAPAPGVGKLTWKYKDRLNAVHSRPPRPSAPPATPAPWTCWPRSTTRPSRHRRRRQQRRAVHPGDGPPQLKNRCQKFVTPMLKSSMQSRSFSSVTTALIGYQASQRGTPSGRRRFIRRFLRRERFPRREQPPDHHVLHPTGFHRPNLLRP